MSRGFGTQFNVDLGEKLIVLSGGSPRPPPGANRVKKEVLLDEIVSVDNRMIFKKVFLFNLSVYRKTLHTQYTYICITTKMQFTSTSSTNMHI